MSKSLLVRRFDGPVGPDLAPDVSDRRASVVPSGHIRRWMKQPSGQPSPVPTLQAAAVDVPGVSAGNKRVPFWPFYT
jgi:hypothetical protein